MQRLLNYIALLYKNIDHAWKKNQPPPTPPKKSKPNQNQPTNKLIQNTTNQTMEINTGFQTGGKKKLSPLHQFTKVQPKCKVKFVLLLRISDSVLQTH